jgi:hypothetical protein
MVFFFLEISSLPGVVVVNSDIQDRNVLDILIMSHRGNEGLGEAVLGCKEVRSHG